MRQLLQLILVLSAWSACVDTHGQYLGQYSIGQSTPGGGSQARLTSIPIQSPSRREAFDAAMSEYLMKMESLRLWAGDKNSARLLLAWSASRSPNFDAAIATHVVDQVSGDLPELAKWAAGYHFVKPGAPGDVKRSTLPDGTAWSRSQRRQAKVVGNEVAGAVAASLGVSREAFAVAAGAVQLQQDVGYIVRDFLSDRCDLVVCIERTFEDHLPGTDDPEGIAQTEAGWRNYDIAETLRGVAFIKSVVRDAGRGAPAEPPLTTRQSAQSRRSDSVPDRSDFRSERRQPAQRYKFLDLMNLTPEVCGSLGGCDDIADPEPPKNEQPKERRPKDKKEMPFRDNVPYQPLG